MFEQVFKNIDDALRKDAGCSSELDKKSAEIMGKLKLIIENEK